MFEVRTNTDKDSRRWDSGKPIGWVVTVDGDWPFFTVEERDDLVVEVRAEELRTSWWAVKDSLPSYYIAENRG